MIRQRGNSLEVIVYQGRDPVTGRSRKVSRTVRGTDKAAMLRARQVELDLAGENHEGRVRDGAGATFGQLMDRWLEHAQIEESTRYLARIRLERHARPALGTIRLSRLRGEDLDDLYLALRRGNRARKALAASSVLRLHHDIRSVLNLGVKLRWLPRNPADDASPPSPPAQDPVAPPTESVRAFIAHLAEHEPEIAMFVRLDAVSGMRRAEVCALRRSDLDFAGGALRKQRALGIARGAPYVKTTKNRKRHTLALDDETLHQLRLHLKGQDELAAHAQAHVGADAYVFSLRVDCSVPMRPDYVTKRIAATRKVMAAAREHDRANDREECPDVSGVTLRGLRHWMATEGFGLGASVKDVQGRGGWARASTPLDHYAAHLRPGDVVLARDLAVLLDDVDEG